MVKLANGVDVGGNEVVVMAGPCSVETREQIFTTAEAVAKAGRESACAAARSSRGVRRTRFRGMGKMG